MKILLLFIGFTLSSLHLFAQDFPFGEVDNQALDMKRYEGDTSAHTVVLDEFGSAKIDTNAYDDLVLKYVYHVRIKFFDNVDFRNFGTFRIPVYSSNGLVFEQVTRRKGVTIWKDDNGQVQKTELDPKNVFTTAIDKHHSVVKFAMPALRKGCVIDVEYERDSPYFIYNFPAWEFQSTIPKIHSEFYASIPGFWTYNVTLRGFLKLTTDKTDIARNCFLQYGAVASCVQYDYGMTNIPAFKTEDYMTSPNNYLSSLSFDIIEKTNLTSGVKTKLSKEWQDVDHDLKKLDEVGGQLKHKELLREKIAPVITGMSDTLTEAKTIYAFIQNSFKWNGRRSFFSSEGIKKALDNHTGNSGDINLALAAALSAAKIPAEAVMLSTRENGIINRLYPSINYFDYVVARITVGGKAYMLDATDPLLPFGMLPMRCLNDRGRVFSLDKPSYWIDMNIGQSERVTYDSDLTLGDDGKIRGTVRRYSMGYSGYEQRKKIKGFNSVDEYVQNLAGKLPKMKILKYSIDNLDSQDKPVVETYEIETDAFKNTDRQQLSFDPFLFDKITVNPFRLTNREYPVDMGMPSDDRYILTVHLPQQYIVENPPANTDVVMPGNGGKFIAGFQSRPDGFTFSHIIAFNKPVYSPDEYSSLKEFYNKIILFEKNEIVFQKKP